MQYHTLSSMSVTPSLKKLPLSYARKHGVFCRDDGEQLQFVYRSGVSPAHLSEARRFVGAVGSYRLLDMSQSEFEQALNDEYQQDSNDAMQMVQGLSDELDLNSLASSVPQAEDLLSREDDAPIIRLINAVLSQAVKQGASDVHIETYERSLQIRFRIDGVLHTAVQPRRELAPLLVSRVKVMAKMDIAEKRVPQDGRISVKVAGREIDVRVSTLPSAYGERLVLRLLDKHAVDFSFQNLGFSTSELQKLREIVHQPHGIFLVSGPTGSGKSTTLYAALAELNDHSRNILTIEDPIEYNLEGVGQAQVNLKADMTFARGLRAMLRQDPDVVMVGEVRDSETAEVAVQASLTGHLVMSTLHTNSAVGAITRLQDMGVEPFLLSSSLVGVLSQRLVRTLCEHCVEDKPADEYESKFLQCVTEKDAVIGRAVGCEHCSHSGYKGRTGIYELLVINDELRQMIHSGHDETMLQQYASSQGTSIRQSGAARVLAKQTTVEEVLRVTQSL